MRVKTSEPERLLLVLDGTVRRQILDLAFDGKLRLTDKAISLFEQIKNPNSAAIVDTVHRLISVAEAMEKARPASAPPT
jgi:hypothetical protein